MSSTARDRNSIHKFSAYRSKTDPYPKLEASINLSPFSHPTMLLVKDYGAYSWFYLVWYFVEMMYRSYARFRDWGLILCARTVSNLILNAETFEPVAGSDSYLVRYMLIGEKELRNAPSQSETILKLPTT